MANETSPDPLSPAECDLRGLPFMPLDVARLIDSDLFALSTGDEFKAAVALWCKSWVQIPAGSLPDDDRVLAHLSSAGKGWSKIKAMALRGWVKCSDGRLYHPVVSEKAKEAWKHRLAQRAKASRRWNKGDGTTTPPERGTTAAQPQHSPGNAAASPTAHAPAMQVTGRGTGTVQEGECTPPGLARAPRPGPMPTLNDPPSRWMSMADKSEVDNEGVERPVVGGFYLDVSAGLVCEAAGINGHVRPVDWLPLVGWLRDGIHLHDRIIPAIRRIASRPGYSPPRFLSYFDGAVREGLAA